MRLPRGDRRARAAANAPHSTSDAASGLPSSDAMRVAGTSKTRWHSLSSGASNSDSFTTTTDPRRSLRRSGSKNWWCIASTAHACDTIGAEVTGSSPTIRVESVLPPRIVPP